MSARSDARGSVARKPAAHGREDVPAFIAFCAACCFFGALLEACAACASCFDALSHTPAAARGRLLGVAPAAQGVDMEGNGWQPSEQPAPEARHSIQAWPLTVWSQVKSLYCLRSPVGRGGLSQGLNSCSGGCFFKHCPRLFGSGTLLRRCGSKFV
jgi:hypothetical protein